MNQKEYENMLPDETEWCYRCEEDIVESTIEINDRHYCVYCADIVLLKEGEEE